MLLATTALDLGCGTGDISIYLAQHGWQVTGVDFIAKALRKARSKAAARHVAVNFIQADVTRLRAAGIGQGFALIVDNGCLHNMTADNRNAYVREVTAVAAPRGLLFIVGFHPGTQRGVIGITQDELDRRLTPAWTLLSAADEPEPEQNGRAPLHHYVFQRQPL